MHRVLVTSPRGRAALRIGSARRLYSRRNRYDDASFGTGCWPRPPQQQQQQQQWSSSSLSISSPSSSSSSSCFASSRRNDLSFAVVTKNMEARALSSSSSSSSMGPSLEHTLEQQPQLLLEPPPQQVGILSQSHTAPIMNKSTDDIWQSTTRHLLSLTNQQWAADAPTMPQQLHQTYQCLQWWARQRPITRLAHSNVWKLWQRLYACGTKRDKLLQKKSLDSNFSMTDKSDSSMPQQQQQQHVTTGAIVTTDLLNMVLDHWRLTTMMTTTKDDDNDIKTPLYIYQHLEKEWIPAGLVNARSYALLLAAMSSQGQAVRDANEAEQVLQRMLSLSSSSSSSSSNSRHTPPNTVVWNTVLGHWAKVAAAAPSDTAVVVSTDTAATVADAGTAANRAMELLQLMKEVQQQQQQQQGVPESESSTAVKAVAAAAKPNAISYASVMEAVLHGHAQPGPVVEGLFQEMLDTVFIRDVDNDTRKQYSSLNSDSHDDNGNDNDNQLAVSSTKALEIAHLRRLQAWAKTDSNRAVEMLKDMRLQYLPSQDNSSRCYVHGNHGGDDGDDCHHEPQLARNVVVAPTSHFYSVVMLALARQPQEQSSSGDSSSLSSSPSPLEQVTTLVEDLYRLYEESNHDERFLPSSSYIYNPILTAFTRKQEQSSKKSDDDDCVAQQAQNLLLSFYQRAQQSSSDSDHAAKCLPDQSCFNTVINAWAESMHPQRIERAKTLVRMMHKATTCGESTATAMTMQPDAYTYSLLIKAWSREATNRSNKEGKRRRALHECRELLRTMWEAYHAERNVSMKPNHITYSTILYAYSKLSRPRLEDVLQAEALFHEMLECSNSSSSGGDPNLAPQQAAYESIMNTWIRSQLPQAAARVAFYFDHLRARSMAAGNSTSRPSVRIYNALLASKKLIGDGDSAEKVLETMMQDFQKQQRRGRSSGDKGDAASSVGVAQPTVATLNTVLMAWSKGCDLASSPATKGLTKESSGRDRLQAYMAASRAEVLVRRMEAFASPNNTSTMHTPPVSCSWEEECRPNTRSYSIVLECWSKLASRKGARRAESLLYGMVQKYDATGDVRVRPNIYCFTTVMLAWSRSGSPDAPERTQLILNELAARYQKEPVASVNNDREIDSGGCWAPNGEAYMALILAWTKSGRPEGPAKALDVLNEMARLHEQDPTTFERPGALNFGAVIDAFAEQGDVENAKRLLHRIWSEHARDGVVLPDRACFVGVIKAYANRAQSISDAPERAELILNDMRQNAVQYGYFQLSPNHQAYNAVLGVWLASRRPEAFERGLTLFHQMVERHPNSNDRHADMDSETNGDTAQQQQRQRQRNVKPVYPSEGFFLTLLRILAQSNRSDKADHANKVVQLLQTCGIHEPYSRALNKAIQICLRPPI